MSDDARLLSLLEVANDEILSLQREVARESFQKERQRSNKKEARKALINMIGQYKNKYIRSIRFIERLLFELQDSPDTNKIVFDIKNFIQSIETPKETHRRNKQINYHNLYNSAQKEIKKLKSELTHEISNRKAQVKAKRKTHDVLQKLYRDTKDQRDNLLVLLEDILLSLEEPKPNKQEIIKDIRNTLENYDDYFEKKNKRIRKNNHPSSP